MHVTNRDETDLHHCGQDLHMAYITTLSRIRTESNHTKEESYTQVKVKSRKASVHVQRGQHKGRGARAWVRDKLSTECKVDSGKE